MKKILFIILFPSMLFCQSSYTVSSGNFYYYPSILTINTGDTVHWVNDDGFHNVNFDISTITGSSFNNPESFISTPTSSYEIYSHVFSIPGSYDYDCSVGSHAANGMVGSIIVNVSAFTDNISVEKYIVSSYNLLGKKANMLLDRVIINRYSDGSVEKILVVE